MAGIAHALTFGANVVRKHFADIDPDHRALRQREERDVGDQQPDQRPLMRVVPKIHATPARQAAVPAAPISKQRLTPQPVDHRHAHHGEDQIGKPDRDGLLVARDLAESSRCKDVVQVVENRVDARQLIECADRDRQK